MLIYRERCDSAYDIIVAFTCLSTKEHVSPTPAGVSPLHSNAFQYLWQLWYDDGLVYDTQNIPTISTAQHP